jgi:hypothetical protein
VRELAKLNGAHDHFFRAAEMIYARLERITVSTESGLTEMAKGIENVTDILPALVPLLTLEV